MFKKIVLSLLCVASMVFGVANAENVVNPYELANSVASKVIDDIKANKDRLADKKVKIPMPGNAESLNVSVAASIIMYEKVRQQMVDFW